MDWKIENKKDMLLADNGSPHWNSGIYCFGIAGKAEA